MQSKEIIAILENEDAKSFITNNIQYDLSDLALRYSAERRFNMAICLQLMGIYKKASRKLPLFVSNFLALDKRSYQQATSERIAKYKCKYLKGETLVDLTAGLGVDSIFLSVSFREVIAVECNEELHQLATFNIKKLGFKNVKRVLGDANYYLHEKVDWAYVDPDRRPDEKRTITLEHLEPNVLSLIPKFSKYCNYVYIKLSPLFDVDEVWRVFKNAATIVILAEQNEIKEVGVILDFHNSGFFRRLLLADVVTGFEYEAEQEELPEWSETNVDELRYLLVPNALLTKSRLCGNYMAKFNVQLHDTFGYYFSSKKYLAPGFRTFRIIDNSGFAPADIRKNLLKENVTKVNLVIKGLNDKPAAWHKKLKTSDGGNFYLFLLKGKTKQAYLCELISSE